REPLLLLYLLHREFVPSRGDRSLHAVSSPPTHRPAFAALLPDGPAAATTRCALREQLPDRPVPRHSLPNTPDNGPSSLPPLQRGRVLRANPSRRAEPGHRYRLSSRPQHGESP